MGKAGGPRYEILTARLGWPELFFSQHCQYCPILPVYLTRVVHQVSLFTSKVVLYSKYQFIDVDGLASIC